MIAAVSFTETTAKIGPPPGATIFSTKGPKFALSATVSFDLSAIKLLIVSVGVAATALVDFSVFLSASLAAKRKFPISSTL